MKNADIIKLDRALKAIDALFTGGKVTGTGTGRISYALGKNLKKTESALAELEAERIKILSRLLSEGKSELKPEDANYNEFVKQYSEVISAENGDFHPHKIELADLNSIGAPISPAIFKDIDPIIDEDGVPDGKPAAS